MTILWTHERTNRTKEHSIIERRINDEIRASVVDLFDQDGHALGRTVITEARRLASLATLDLVQVGGDDDVPRCRITNAKKLLFDDAVKEATRKHESER